MYFISSSPICMFIGNIGPMEWILIIIALVILLIWGPSKIPGLARAIGQAIREFKMGVRGAEEERKEAVVRQEAASKAQEQIVDIAKRLGIDVSGKTTEQILSEISKKLDEKTSERRQSA